MIWVIMLRLELDSLSSCRRKCSLSRCPAGYCEVDCQQAEAQTKLGDAAGQWF